MKADSDLVARKAAKTFQDRSAAVPAALWASEDTGATQQPAPLHLQEKCSKQETYGLSLQMRRAAVSIAANIAEGFRKRGKADKARFMNMAEGSLEETRYYLILAHDL